MTGNSQNAFPMPLIKNARQYGWEEVLPRWEALIEAHAKK